MSEQLHCVNCNKVVDEEELNEHGFATSYGELLEICRECANYLSEIQASFELKFPKLLIFFGVKE